MAGTHSPTELLEPVRALAEAAANQRGTSLLGSDLRLFAEVRSVDSGAVVAATSDERVSPYALGRAYELLLAPTSRRATGSHLTPERVANSLVAMMPMASPTDRVLDPAVGGAAFLLAAADQLVEQGAKPSDVLTQLHGVDIEPDAVAVAEAALAIWGLSEGVPVQRLEGLICADGLLCELPEVERVVGNPPFLNQLRNASTNTAQRRGALRERWGPLLGPYTDDAWLFLAAGLEALASEGALALVQPVSILSARDAAAVRERLHEHWSLTGLWVGRDRVFDASVQVCGVVAATSAATSEQTTAHQQGHVARRVGANFEAYAPIARQPHPNEWAPAAAATVGIPELGELVGNGVVGDIASTTAGFRDQFYGFVPHCYEASDDVEPDAKLVTVGMIDVATLHWGKREFRFAKQRVIRPAIDLETLRANDPSLAKWTADRLRPKLLMATQTRVVEVWVDEVGDTVPATPVVSIEPHHHDADSLWLLAAALSSPGVSARLMGKKFGTALSINSMKLSARDVLSIPLPADPEAWRRGAEVLRNGGDRARFAHEMGVAYGLADDELAQWWLGRVES